MPANNFNIQGLSNEQVSAAREKWGYNKLSYKKENGFFDAVISLAKEPMVFNFSKALRLLEFWYKEIAANIDTYKIDRGRYKQ